MLKDVRLNPHLLTVPANVGGKPCRASRQMMVQTPTTTTPAKDKFSARLSVGCDGVAVVSILVADTKGNPIPGAAEASRRAVGVRVRFELSSSSTPSCCVVFEYDRYGCTIKYVLFQPLL